MAATVVIPARYGSTRFPAKILANATGRPLVQHVVDRAKKCRLVSDVIVATDDQRIVDALRPFETRVVMTSPAHQSGTDRIAEVARGLLLAANILRLSGGDSTFTAETYRSSIERYESLVKANPNNKDLQAQLEQARAAAKP